MAESTMNFRLDEDLKKAFELVAKEQDMTASQLLRKYIRREVEDYVTKKAQSDLFKAEKNNRTVSGNSKAKKPAKKPEKGLLNDLLKNAGI